ncbi:adenosylcobinamide-GDP ribazoletransferase [Pseudaminobacter sp. NGMCC 1.201702]|uniref:adenosylcobinamide-GDP ribazoletransferase n=1 Tax=Pseudaminobacter sp. NGMCC 1.201702 TaxID=3391825 RepID=UPI0039EFF476
MNSLTGRSLARDVAFCLIFFTRLPLPAVDLKEAKLAASIWAAPVVGLVVAIIGALVYAIATFLGLPPAPSAVLAVAATLLATGCLHEDGLSDTADGFGGGTTRERKLEIMRDSRIGTYGACALLFSILLRWSALSSIAGPAEVASALIAAHVASRALIPAFMRFLPAARLDGLSANAGLISANASNGALALGLISLLVLGLPGMFAAALCLGLAFALFRGLCLRQIGGHTGDTVGAMQQIGEITLLLAASVIFS